MGSNLKEKIDRKILHEKEVKQSREETFEFSVKKYKNRRIKKENNRLEEEENGGKKHHCNL